MTKIFFWAADEGGSAFYRCELPAISLQWLGHQTGVSRDGRVAREADVVMGARVANADATRWWRELKDMGKRLVLDMDDDYLVLDSRHHSQKGIDEWADHRDRLLANIALADAVTVASPALAEVYGQYNPNVHVIPNGLPAQYLGRHRDYSPEIVNVGWVGTSSSRGGLEMIKHPLRKVSERDDVKVVLVGPQPNDDYLRGLKDRRIGCTGFIRSVKLYLDAVTNFDMWVAPYEESAFNRAKFPTKVLEAGFLGIPLIASAIRPYAEEIEHGKTGFLVKSDHEWRRYMNLLLGDPDLRREIGLNARARISKWIMQSLNQRWEQVLCGTSSPVTQGSLAVVSANA
jgi:glycosyltransferase involved in cell wall biosynthesis